MDRPSEEEYESLPANTPMSISMAAGSVAGIMEHTIMYPVDAIKTRMQVAGANGLYRGVIKSMSRVSASEGFRSLWRGMTSMVVGAGPAHAIHFAVYEGVINLLSQNGHASSHPGVSALAGASATICGDLLMNPFDVIKQRMQVHDVYHGLTRTAVTIFRNEGIAAFYVSYPTTLLMSVPFAAVNMTVYDSISLFLNPSRTHDPLIHCVAGGISGAAAAAVSTPFDVIRTLLQTRGITQDIEARNLNSLSRTASYLYRTRGVSGFFRGIRPRVVSNMPSTAISWTVYEMAKHYITRNTT